MAVYLITYDLKDHASGYDYTSLHNVIKGFGSWLHPLESTWFVDTNLDANTMSQRIKSVYQPESHLVLEISNADRQGWLPKTSWDWLRQHLT